MNGSSGVFGKIAVSIVVAAFFACTSMASDAATQRKSHTTTGAASKSKAKPSTARGSAKRRAAARPVAVAKPSFGELQGLRATDDPLDLRSSVALVVDQDTHEVLLEKNAQAVLPIASLTKLMTSLVVVEAGLPLEETLTITQDDVDTEKGSGSRLTPGTQLTRGELLHLALMSSENRAAHALGRHYPGGLDAFVGAMNAKAALLGMGATRFVEPTGLSSKNQSSAHDLATLAAAASEHPLIRELSTSPGYTVPVGSRFVQYRNTNRLVLNPAWDIGLQKTGYITEAGRCLVMQAQLAGRKLIMIFLDSAGRYSRLGDAERVRHWIEGTPSLFGQPQTPAHHAPQILPVTSPLPSAATPLS